MLLLHTVLAVVYGGLLASAHPGPRDRARPTEDAEIWPYAADYQPAEASSQHEGVWEWGAPARQMYMEDGRVHGAEAANVDRQQPVPFPDDDPKAPEHGPPEPPHDLPKPPSGPPQHPPPPPPPGFPPKFPPGPPPPGPPPPGDHPPPPHQPHGNTSSLTIYQILESNPQ